MIEMAGVETRRPTAAAYRALMGSFPTGVTVVTAIDGTGRPHGLTCTSLTSVSVAPPMVLVCLNLASGTYAAIRDTGAFAVNLLRPLGRRAAEVFAGRVPDRFAAVDWEPSPAGLPWLVEDAFALAECRVHAVHRAADHAIVVAAVEGLSHRSDAVLMYGMRRFSRWPVAEGE